MSARRLTPRNNSIETYNKIVGGRICGYSGDGGQAGNAEISDTVGQITFDLAGNLYFTDTNNQRVRRVSAATGIITTVAGNGVAGYAGDGAESIFANLSSPTGISVDSQGQVYIISSAASTGTAQVIRKLGTQGDLVWGSFKIGTSGPLHLLTVSNIGNNAMTLSSFLINGTNPGDFSIDPNTTSCVLTAGATLIEGQSCNIGVIFKPTATGVRSATLTFLDNTVTNINTVLLSGAGSTSAPAVKATPATVAFPTTAPQHTSAQAITVTNAGTADLKISGITAGGANPAAFSYTNSCGAAVAPKASCTLLVNFKPSSTGNYAAKFNIADNAPDSPQTVSVAGTSAAPSPTSIRLASTTNPNGPCSPVAFQVQVTAAADGVPTGTAHLVRGSLVLDSAELKNGVATFSAAGLKPGVNLVFATYDGDPIHNPSTSSELRQVIASDPACIFGRLQLHP